MADNNSDNRGIVRYTSKDYESLMQDYWNVVPTLTDLWSPESDADPGVVLGKFLASCADMLSINTDLVANEVYAPSVSQRKNAEKIFGLIGYDLGWYRASVTELTITNNSGDDLTIDLGFNGNSFCTVNAYTDITDADRVITYNILPGTSTYSKADSKSTRSVVTSSQDVFTDSDVVVLRNGDSCTRVAVEGELRNYAVSVADVKSNNYKITLPSQHIDTTKIWVKSKSSLSDERFLETQWKQCANIAEFIYPEPRFAVTYDNYSNAQITISNYLNQLENYESNYLIVYWIDCSGVIGCVGEDVLTNLIFAKDQVVSPSSGDLSLSNLSNTVEMPNTYTVTGASPETAREAYFSSRNYINTWDSLITLPDFNRFLNRESGVDCGVVLDCQAMLEYNMAVYEDDALTASQKSKMYVTNYDFPSGPDDFDWGAVLNLGFDPSDPQKFVFATNFKRYTAMCFAIHNDFKDSSYGQGKVSRAQVKNAIKFQRYKPPANFISAVQRDYAPLKAMTVELDFGFIRVFNFYVVGQIYTKSPVSVDVGASIVAAVKEALALHFAPANRSLGVLPTVAEIVEVISNADSRIAYFDAGSPVTPVVTWDGCDIEYFNLISFARMVDPGPTSNNIRIAPSSLLK